MNADNLTYVWKALADPSRRRILDILRDRPRTTGEIVSAFDFTRAAGIKHLYVLRQAGLVVVRKQGRECWNYLNAVPLRRIYERWLSPYGEHWSVALLGLERQVASSSGRGCGMTEKIADIETAGVLRIEQEIQLEAKPEEVFKALTEDVGCWWGAPYLRDEKLARDIVLEPRLGGRFYEDWGDGGGFTWAVVNGFRRNEMLLLVGGIGSRLAVLSTLMFTLEPKDNGTLLKLSHHLTGESAGSFTEYEAGWTDLFVNRLKPFVEQGKMSGIRN